MRCTECLRGGRSSSALPGPLLFALVFLALVAANASAFTFEPIVQDFAPAGPGSIQSFLLTNTGTETIAVRIVMLTREMDLDGTEVNLPVDQLFTVYPSRIVLPANEQQAVRIQWKGPADPPVEQCYRILVEQLPVDFGTEQKQKNSIKVMFRYMGAIYVVPSGATPDVVMDSSRVTLDPQGRDALELVFANRGRAHTLLGDLTITLTANGANSAVRRELGPDALVGVNGENLLPGTKRRFWLPLPADLPRDGIDVAFRFKAIR
jgi:fimbrial chaperone protein